MADCQCSDCIGFWRLVAKGILPERGIAWRYHHCSEVIAVRRRDMSIMNQLNVTNDISEFELFRVIVIPKNFMFEDWYSWIETIIWISKLDRLAGWKCQIRIKLDYFNKDVFHERWKTLVVFGGQLVDTSWNRPVKLMLLIQWSHQFRSHVNTVFGS